MLTTCLSALCSTPPDALVGTGLAPDQGLEELLRFPLSTAREEQACALGGERLGGQQPAHCQCLELCPSKERSPLQMDPSEAMLSSSHPAPTVTATPPCPAKSASVDLSCDTEQLLSRNIYLVRWCDLFAIVPVVRFPGCLWSFRVLQHVESKQSLFLSVFGFFCVCFVIIDGKALVQDMDFLWTSTSKK